MLGALARATGVLFLVSLSHHGMPQAVCGVERWPVKTLADQDAARVDTTPIPITLAALGALPIPEVPYPRDARLAPHELRVYRVVAQIGQILSEEDQDWHLVLRDPDDPRITLIAEIPDPVCAANALHAAQYRAARAFLRTQPRGAVVTVEGVGFWDFIHNQRGRARNGFELHPVLRIGDAGA